MQVHKLYMQLPDFTHIQMYFNPLKTKCIYVIYGLSPYRAVNTLHHGYKKQTVKVV